MIFGLNIESGKGVEPKVSNHAIYMQKEYARRVEDRKKTDMVNQETITKV